MRGQEGRGEKRILGVSEHAEHFSMRANLILSPVCPSPCLWICKCPALQNPASLQIGIRVPGPGGSGTSSSGSPAFLGNQTPWRRRSRSPCFVVVANPLEARLTRMPHVYPEANVTAHGGCLYGVNPADQVCFQNVCEPLC